MPAANDRSVEAVRCRRTGIDDAEGDANSAAAAVSAPAAVALVVVVVVKGSVSACSSTPATPTPPPAPASDDVGGGKTRGGFLTARTSDEGTSEL